MLESVGENELSSILSDFLCLKNLEIKRFIHNNVKDVATEDKVLIVRKQNKPQNVVVSYERYKRLIDEGADI